MPAEIYMQKRGAALIPVDQASFDQLAKVRNGVEVKAVVTVPRNLRFHRLFFALIHYLFDLQDTWPTVEAFRTRLLCGVGHGEIVEAKGVKVMVAHSISFAKMDDVAFRELAERVIRLFCERIAPHLSNSQRSGAYDILDGDGPPMISNQTPQETDERSAA